ncbi:MAG TPA: pirin family protein, partial [Vicinamibacteria bacterium]
MVEAHPGRATLLGDLAIRRLLPARGRRLVGPWCFLDAFGPLAFASGKPMDVPPHPHIGLQTVSWLLDGELLHRDSIGGLAVGRAGSLNLMTAGRGIAHSEETPPSPAGGRLEGVQLWVALPDAHRHAEPSFEHHADLPALDLDGGRATVFLGSLGGRQAPGRAFSPIIGADVQVGPGRTVAVPLDPTFEHA